MNNDIKKSGRQLIKLCKGITVCLMALNYCWADGLPDFFTSTNNSSDSLLDAYTMLPESDFMFVDKKNRYIGEDQPIHEDSLLQNNFFEDDNLRIYNNTQYSFDGIRDKYTQSQVNQVGIDDLSISLGYGMEFRIRKNRFIGYEYISSYPYDRGQSIRLFLKFTF